LISLLIKQRGFHLLHHARVHRAELGLTTLSRVFLVRAELRMFGFVILAPTSSCSAFSD
jgi:hypothetical protein